MKYTKIALISALILAGCGTETDSKLTTKMFNILKTSLTKKDKATEGAVKISEAQVQQILKEQPKPVFFARIVSRGSISLLVEVSKSRGYTTYFTSYSESITARGGIITATRGVGGDLMSTESSQSASLIRSRTSGKASRKMRYIGKNEHSEEIDFICSISKGPSYKYKFGEIATTVTEMQEACVTDGKEFTNTYLVDPTGFVVKSHQWVSPTFEYIDTEFLRK